MTKLTDEQKAALQELARSIIDAAKDGGKLGAPIGPMYAALMGGLTLDKFNQVISQLIQAGFLDRRGNVVFWLKDFPKAA